MNLRLKQITLALATLCIVSQAQAALQGRDSNNLVVANNAVGAVMFFDTDLGITWLRDANAMKILNGGLLSSTQAQDFIDSLNSDGGTYGFTNWRLPTQSEFVDLWSNELGNSGSFANKGDFKRFQSGLYWSAGNVTFNTSTGSAGGAALSAYAIAVHTVPEPETYAMLLAGLVAVGTMTARRRAQGK